ncbi:MAG: peptidoglycan DD-metalloendopeptidase family protein [Oscillospiraceae bacterium]|nr:peptidoglycan DD-metalloendopeptidase family protein [Oscillospiraceae bacterium]
MEAAKEELDATQAELDAKREEADALIQELLTKADDLEALEAEFEAQEQAFLEEIAKKEEEFDAAKQAEWEAYMATYVPPTTAPPAGGTNNSGGTTNNSGGGSTVRPGGSSGGGWVVPCSYTSITSPFGYRVSPTSGASTYHQGVDLDTGTGWSVVATRAGTVSFAGWGTAAGNYVKINHHDGFSSIYMHLSSIGVRAGQNVAAGQYIGATGSTGVSTGDHLHFGISLNGVYVNPCSYVPLY